jgi:apolipoprotein D and lipocalin family protein
MKILAPVLAVALGLAVSACTPFVPSSRYYTAPMFVVSNLDTSRIMGKWYQVASFPAPFQAGCGLTTAEYSARQDGLIGVRNRCEVVGQPGTVREILGTAGMDGPGQLKIKLDGVPFPAKYWVLYLSRDGRTLIVGTPSRVGGWVLRRDRSISDEQFHQAGEVFERNGYDIAALQRSALR